MEVFPNVRKYVGIPDCLTIASTSYKKLFPDCWCFFDWTYKWKCIVLCNKSFDCSFKITFNCSCCECTWFDFLPSKVYWWTQMEMLIYRRGKIYIICIWCTVLIKVQQPLNSTKYQAGLIGIISRNFEAKFTLWRRIRKCLFFTELIA